MCKNIGEIPDMKKEQTFRNPILQGFHPDPSICRVEEDYYMVTSSFAYYPGIPVFHSRDLIHWEQIGHCIHKIDQLDYKNCEMSWGIWAPTIRFHKGKFYVINTFVTGGREDVDGIEGEKENYIVTAEKPAGPWSDPIIIRGADGIDPSVFFDEDGSMWYVGNFTCKDALYEGHHGIYVQKLDKHTFQLIGTRTVIWDGRQTNGKWIEAPHIYKKDGWYYLIVAEGGTFTNHSVQMARCRTINGKYEFCPRNPIVTHRHMPLMNEIAAVGHADIIETQNGEWWMVLLGVRPYEGFHVNLGRETFLVPIVWQQDGWPLLDTANGMVNQRERKPHLPGHIYPLSVPYDNFEDTQLGVQWNTIHPPKKMFYSLTENPGYLRLHLNKKTLSEKGTPSFVGRRQEHKIFQTATAMVFIPRSQGEEAGIVLFQDCKHHYSLTEYWSGNQRRLRLTCVYDEEKEILADCILDDMRFEHKDRIYLAVQGNVTKYCFYYGYKESERIPIGKDVNADVLCSNVNHGFTGVYIGMYGSTNGAAIESYADFDWFLYFGTEE